MKMRSAMMVLVLSLFTFAFTNTITHYVRGDILWVRKEGRSKTFRIKMIIGERLFSEIFRVRNCDIEKEDGNIVLKVVLVPFFDRADPRKNRVMYFWEDRLIKNVRVHNLDFVRMYRTSSSSKYNFWMQESIRQAELK